ncbi:MAG: LPS export ABC transporter ATP-binding protein [Neisseriaceae bacterium]|nr:MAG: LPS export ABC transporter ATP-binding protein [Neisseriaceae bacterium]
MKNSVSTLNIIRISKKIQKKQIVKDISLSVQSGQIVSLLGSNGAGKTTLFYIIVGLVAADSGKILLDDNNIINLPIHKRSQLGLGYLPQEASIFRKLTVEDNILSILELHYHKTEQKKMLKKIMSDLNISHIKNSLGLSVSGGERRRIEIARVLASKPRFILLDEPFAGVDPLSISDIQNIILFLKQQGIGVLITDHNVRETFKICDYSYIINNGQLLAEGIPSELTNNEIVKKVYLGEEFIF